MKHGNLIYEPKKGHPLVECALDCLMLSRMRTLDEIEAKLLGGSR